MSQAPRWLLELLPALRRLHMVEWDRWAGGEEGGSVFGWIEREDGRADFVNIVATPNGNNLATSSASWHDAVMDIWLGEEAKRLMEQEGAAEPWPELAKWLSEPAAACVRVENVFPGEVLPNAVRELPGGKR